jgi:hypothetical protein
VWDIWWVKLKFMQCKSFFGVLCVIARVWVCKPIRQDKTDVLDVCWYILSRDKLGRKAQYFLMIKRFVFGRIADFFVVSCRERCVGSSVWGVHMWDWKVSNKSSRWDASVGTVNHCDMILVVVQRTKDNCARALWHLVKNLRWEQELTWAVYSN